MSKSAIGVLTIGQSPRVDVTPSMEKIFGSNILVKEAGALDYLSEEELIAIQPTEDTEDVYVSRLRNGRSIKINKNKLIPLLQKELSYLESVSDIVIILCTGDFKELITTKPIIYPDRILSHSINGIMEAGKLGLIIPLEEQKNSVLQKWDQKGLQILTEIATPYESSDLSFAAKALKQRGAEIIVLDCMGYNESHKEVAIKASGLPVILPRTLVASIVNEYVPKKSK